ncbi:MAG: hypothetical protein MUD10_00815 [Candidatus Pacebacteria bacterium]|jgi:hypothetical protein|nr:hypothetical protein [Candidatus Paceibacterota bacterium]
MAEKNGMFEEMEPGKYEDQDRGVEESEEETVAATGEEIDKVFLRIEEILAKNGDTQEAIALLEGMEELLGENKPDYTSDPILMERINDARKSILEIENEQKNTKGGAMTKSNNPAEQAAA